MTKSDDFGRTPRQKKKNNNNNGTALSPDFGSDAEGAGSERFESRGDPRKNFVAPGNFLFFCCCSSRQLANNIMQLRWQYYNNDHHQKCLAGDNSPAFINKTLKNALNVANISPEDLAKVIFVRTLIIRSVLDSCWFDTVYSCSVSDKIDFSWQCNDKNKLNVNLFTYVQRAVACQTQQNRSSRPRSCQNNDDHKNQK